MPVCRLALPESIGHQNAELLLQQLQQQLQERLSAGECEQVEVDAAALRQFDSSALALLLALLRTVQQKQCAWKVTNPPERLLDLAALYGLDVLLAISTAKAGIE